MIRKSIKLCALGLTLSIGAYAQSVLDGVKALYNGKYFEAVQILSKQTDKPDAAYWLAQTYLENGDSAAAAGVIDKAIAAKPNEPLLMVAKGQLLLMGNKTNEAKQSFEAAIAASSSKKKEDPAILNAVGKAVTKVYNNVTHIGDINYAVEKLEAAAAIVNDIKKKKDEDNWLLADIYTNLGDAYRKAKPGEGSLAFQNYQNALTAEPLFSPAEFRKALIFKSQRNYELYVTGLENTVAKNPGFLPAYHALYEYRIGVNHLDVAQGIAEKIKENSPNDPNNEYYAAQTYYLNNQFDQAISAAKNVIATAKDLANPKAYKLIAYGLLGKKDTAAAIPFIEEYFKKQLKDEIVPKDYSLKAMAYSTTPGKEDVIFQSYIDGLKADTVLDNRLDLIADGAKFFGDRGRYELQGDLYAKVLEYKPKDKLVINDFFNAGYYGYYRAKDYEKSWKIFDQARTQFPDLNYGYVWTLNNSKIIDSANTRGMLLPDAEKLLAFYKTDASEDAKKTIASTAYTLANYYNDVEKNKGKAVEYLKLMYDNTTDEAVKQEIEKIIQSLSRNAAANAANKAANKPKQ
ncbi:MAG: CDC27 family protein [Niabella sp.]